MKQTTGKDKQLEQNIKTFIMAITHGEQARIIKIIEEFGKDSTGTVGLVLKTVKPEIIKLILNK